MSPKIDNAGDLIIHLEDIVWALSPEGKRKLFEFAITEGHFNEFIVDLTKGDAVFEDCIYNSTHNIQTGEITRSANVSRKLMLDNMKELHDRTYESIERDYKGACAEVQKLQEKLVIVHKNNQNLEGQITMLYEKNQTLEKLLANPEVQRVIERKNSRKFPGYSVEELNLLTVEELNLLAEDVEKKQRELLNPEKHL